MSYLIPAFRTAPRLSRIVAIVALAACRGRGGVEGDVFARTVAGEPRAAAGITVRLLRADAAFEDSLNAICSRSVRLRNNLLGRLTAAMDSSNRQWASARDADRYIAFTNAAAALNDSLVRAAKDVLAYIDDYVRRSTVDSVESRISGKFSFASVPAGKYTLLAMDFPGTQRVRWTTTVEVQRNRTTLKDLGPSLMRTDAFCALGPDDFHRYVEALTPEQVVAARARAGRERVAERAAVRAAAVESEKADSELLKYRRDLAQPILQGDANRPYFEHDVDKAAALVSSTDILFRDSHAHGRISFSFILSADGQPEAGTLTIRDAEGDGLRQALSTHYTEMRYTPATKGGRRVRQWIEQTVTR